MTPSLRVAFVAWLCAAAFGCAGVAPPLRDGSLDTVTRPRGYRGELRIRIDGDRGGGSFGAIVLARPPELAEVIAVDPLGRTIADYIITPGGIREAAGALTGPFPPDLLPSDTWYSIAFTLLGGRLPGPPRGPRCRSGAGIAPPTPCRVSN